MTEQASCTAFAETVLSLDLCPYRHLHPRRSYHRPLRADSSAPRSSPMADREALDPCTSGIRDIPASLLERRSAIRAAHWGRTVGWTAHRNLTMSVNNPNNTRKREERRLDKRNLPYSHRSNRTEPQSPNLSGKNPPQ